MSLTIRPLAAADLENSAKILESAFQRQGHWSNDLAIYLRLQPDGYFIAEEDGVGVGMVGSIIYSQYAYVGLMAVHSESQRRGIGLALMQHLLTWLDRQHVSLVLLDASLSGRPLYEKLGFVSYGNVGIYQRGTGQSTWSCPAHVKPISISDLELISVTDVDAFGTDRSRVLRLLLDTYPDRAFLLPDGNGKILGYLFAQEYRIGPWIMQDGRYAEDLLRAALSLPFREGISVAVPEENFLAVTLLRQYGFDLVRTNCHMGRGPGMPTGQRVEVFAQTSLSLG